MYEFKMPALGAEMTQGRLLEWKIKVGDKIKLHDIIAVIDTDKVAIEIESFGEGVVEKLITVPDEKVAVGTIMALIRETGEQSKKSTQIIQQAIPVKISPLAKKLASQLGIDITKIKGSGFDGAIVENDIKNSMVDKTALAKPAVEDHAGSMKKVIAAAMTKSKREIPHYYLSCEIDLNNALHWLEKYNSKHSTADRMLYSALLIKAVANAIKQYPGFNGFFVNNEFKSSAAINIGMAISLRGGGLIAPGILHVENMNLIDIMKNLLDLVIRARTGKLRSVELSDPTITITNLGELGVDSVFGIIYPPQVALVGFGKISPHKSIIVTLAADHRVTNGYLGGRFLSAINGFLQDPETL